MSRFLKQKNRSKGDTLIEVLISIAIAGFVISGAYALSSHSLEEGVSATERTEANKVAAAQIEALKLRQKDSTAAWTNAYPGGFASIPPTDSFCLNTKALTEFNTGGPSPTPNPDWLPQPNPRGTTFIDSQTDQINTGYYNVSNPNPDDNCVKNGKYYVSVSANGNSGPTSNGQVFYIEILWESPGGGPLNKSQLYYRLPQS